MRSIALALILCAACGDNHATGPDADAPDAVAPDADPGCGAAPLPAGPLTDPLAMPLPADCVPGGAAQMIGRWFTESDDHTEVGTYLRFDAGCGGLGLREHLVAPSQITDRGRHDTWFDATRIFIRDEMDYAVDTSYITATAACALPNGELATVRGIAHVLPGSPGDNTGFLPVARGPRFATADAPAAGMTLVGAIASRADGTAIDAYNLVVDGDHAYVAGPNGFDVIDVADPAHPTVVGHVDGFCNDVRVATGGGRTIAFVADNTTRLIDVTDPAAPVAFAALGTPAHSLEVASSGGSRLLYVADGFSSAVPVFEITDPTVPVPVTTMTIPDELGGGVHDLFVDADHAMLYVNDTFDGTAALDISAGVDAAVELKRFHSGENEYSHGSWAGVAGGRRVVLTADEGWLGGADGFAFLHVLDGDPASPGFMTELGRYQNRREVGIHYFVLAGDKVYIAYYEDGVRVVDLADPTHPVEVAHYNTWNDDATPSQTISGAFSVRVANGLVFVADSTRGLVILREDRAP